MEENVKQYIGVLVNGIENKDNIDLPQVRKELLTLSANQLISIGRHFNVTLRQNKNKMITDLLNATVESAHRTRMIRGY